MYKCSNPSVLWSDLVPNTIITIITCTKSQSTFHLAQGESERRCFGGESDGGGDMARSGGVAWNLMGISKRHLDLVGPRCSQTPKNGRRRGTEVVG